MSFDMDAARDNYIRLCEKERDNAPNTAMRLYWEQVIQDYLKGTS